LRVVYGAGWSRTIGFQADAGRGSGRVRDSSARADRNVSSDLRSEIRRGSLRSACVPEEDGKDVPPRYRSGETAVPVDRSQFMKKTTRKSGMESSGNIFIDLGFQ